VCVCDAGSLHHLVDVVHLHNALLGLQSADLVVVLPPARHRDQQREMCRLVAGRLDSSHRVDLDAVHQLICLHRETAVDWQDLATVDTARLLQTKNRSHRPEDHISHNQTAGNTQVLRRDRKHLQNLASAAGRQHQCLMKNNE